MATTCKLIAKNVLGSDTATVTFSSIPGTYTDLLLVASVRSTRSSVLDVLEVFFNSTQTSTYSYRALTATGSAGSESGSSMTAIWSGYVSGNNATSNAFGSSEIYVPNYAGSTAKTVSATSMSEDNASTAYMAAVAGLWTGTSAITQISIQSYNAASIKSGSSFFLYGITKA